MLHTDIQTDRHTYRASDEAGPRGAFAPNNKSLLKVTGSVFRSFQSIKGLNRWRGKVDPGFGALHPGFGMNLGFGMSLGFGAMHTGFGMNAWDTLLKL